MMTCVSMTRIGMQGFLLAMSPLPLLFLFAETGHIGGPAFWRLILAVAAAVSIFSCALTLFCKPIAGKFLGVAGAAGGYISAWPHIMTSPYFALTATVLLIGIIFLLADFTFEGPAARKTLVETQKPVWEIFLSHPARVLVVTFLGLCAMGTLLLLLPVAADNRAIGFVDAAFTSVSAVCVTGLIVLDTPNDFTGYGQFFILILIQLGGLGIMGITTVGLHAMGRRISLTHERVLASMADTNHRDLVHSLVTILKFTFAAEGMGAILLAFMFYSTGDPVTQAVWRGVFTAVSAFCNAGFALQSDSLMFWQTTPGVLHIVALLIVFGGMAPATALVIPKWLSGRQVPIPARIALAASVVLLVLGTVFILAFEWGGLLAGLSVSDKIQNAWFQSVTLRTAGFNSVDIAGIAHPTFLLMLAFMFIGGSPGGTAGGVKTTTMGILAMTFFANITNRREVIMQNRRISAFTIFRAVTIVAAGLLLWFGVVLMLEVTQPQIPVRDLIFEATSALGTVGLSTGATGLLDEIGKIIIIIAMFCGRIGPVTLFMLLSDQQAPSSSQSPDAKIFLT